jgi:hypothetical protein
LAARFEDDAEGIWAFWRMLRAFWASLMLEDIVKEIEIFKEDDEDDEGGREKLKENFCWGYQLKKRAFINTYAGDSGGGAVERSTWAPLSPVREKPLHLPNRVLPASFSTLRPSVSGSAFIDAYYIQPWEPPRSHRDRLLHLSATVLEVWSSQQVW